MGWRGCSRSGRASASDSFSWVNRQNITEPEEDESESESASDDEEKGKPNPLKVWAKSMLTRMALRGLGG